MPAAPAPFAFALAVLLVLPNPARAEHQPQDLRLTTDTLEYCHALARRLESMPGHMEPTPRLLGQQGRRLCARGHVKTGIARLRRAIRITAGKQSDGG
ncbi:hypothetical protein [Sabulicella rubraurantiaca]|uniref:hypothetical protein n=1 Tax=Sabulicella rubraurantiaca TaxID=2811429 RepID=UPI001A96F464|nr:hypothetical protein [Sabulicella rubraurantiaca]